MTTDPALGRSVAESSVCLTDGLNALGATKILSRNFRIVVPDEPSSTADPGNELAGQPSIYTQALQFSTEAEAEEAVEAYRDWIAECSALLESRGYTVLGELNRTWYPVNVDTEGATGQFAELTYRAPGQSEDFGWWEAIGLTQRGDRLMITVSLTVGQDKNVAYEQYPADPDLMALHEQYALIIAAAERWDARRPPGLRADAGLTAIQTCVSAQTAPAPSRGSQRRASASWPARQTGAGSTHFLRRPSGRRSRRPSPGAGCLG